MLIAYLLITGAASHFALSQVVSVPHEKIIARA